jgi:hypothetical protein
MSDTKKFKVVESFEFEGETVEVGAEIELTPEQVAVFGSKLDRVVDEVKAEEGASETDAPAAQDASGSTAAPTAQDASGSTAAPVDAAPADPAV